MDMLPSELNTGMRLQDTSDKVENGVRYLLIIPIEQALMMTVLDGHILQRHVLRKHYM